jgi:hypothetical protein
MDKIITILNKAKSSLTIWLGVAIVALGQIQPVADFFVGLVNKVAPGYAATATAIVLVLARLRSIIIAAQQAINDRSAGSDTGQPPAK